MRALSTFVREIFFVLTLFGMISLEHVKILFFFFFFKLSFKKMEKLHERSEREMKWE
jgi:hypothetical protein